MRFIGLVFCVKVKLILSKDSVLSAMILLLWHISSSPRGIPRSGVDGNVASWRTERGWLRLARFGALREALNRCRQP